MTHKKQLRVADNQGARRLDIFLSETLNESRSKIRKLIKGGSVLVNSKPAKKVGQSMADGDIVVVTIPEMEPLLVPDILVIAETDEYIVIEKPRGVVVHPKQEQITEKELSQTGTVAAWVAAQRPKIFGVGEYANRPGIVHRLDKEASGVMVVAKTQESFESIKRQFKEHSIDKIYSALVHGVIGKDHDTINFLIARGSRGTMVARPRHEAVTLRNVAHVQEGREALTEFWVEKSYPHYTLLRVRLHTGRTHQIRVHLFAYGHPIAGDPLYVNKKIQTNEHSPRLFLHATSIAFRDLEGERRTFSSALPQDLADFLTALA